MTDLQIKLKAKTPREAATRDQLLALLGQHDLSKWLYTHRVVIDEQAIPHSHPVLTLHARHLDQDDLLLSTFVHEQLHWLLATKRKPVGYAIDVLRDMFPDVPVGPPEGALDRDSSYLHLIVNYLELEAMKEIVGDERARLAFEFWFTDHYTGLYGIVLDNQVEIAALIDRFELRP